MDNKEPISEEWLKSAGFKWHQFDRQTEKQWCLWLGSCMDCPPSDDPDNQQYWRFSGDEDFAIEVACNSRGIGDRNNHFWFCWFRGDSAGRYHRFIHVRHIRYQHEVIALVSALTGREWKPDNHFNGSAKCERCAARIRMERERMDIRHRESVVKWSEVEKDDTRGRSLPEHMEAAIKSGLAK